MKKFKKIVILDRIILSKEQWKRLNGLAEEVQEFSGLTPKQIMQKLEKEQGKDPGAVCFTALAKEDMTIKELQARVKGADAIISCWTNLPDEILLQNPQLKYIGYWTNLINHRLNLDLTKELGIKVTYIPDYGTIAVAEYTFALILELMRKVGKQAHDTLRGKWPYELLKSSLHVPEVSMIPYHTLHGKKLGIIGFGKIGKHVAQIAKGFEMRVYYFSRNRHKSFEERGIEFLELDNLLKTSDIISLHLSPYAYVDELKRIQLDDHAPDCPESEPQAKHQFVIDKQKIKTMKDGSLFINTSAGRLVDEEALLQEAISGRISIALDVYQSSPNKKLLKQVIQAQGKHNNIFTYRGGWLTYESVLYKGDSLINQMQEFLDQRS